jgi:cytochrome c553
LSTTGAGLLRERHGDFLRFRSLGEACRLLSRCGVDDVVLRHRVAHDEASTLTHAATGAGFHDLPLTRRADRGRAKPGQKPWSRWTPDIPRLALLLALTVGALSLSVEASEGERIAWQYRCASCHGSDGRGLDSRFPNLAGQNAPYIEARLRYFRARVEPGNPMNAQATGLTDTEITALAAYFSEIR